MSTMISGSITTYDTQPDPDRELYQNVIKLRDQLLGISPPKSTSFNQHHSLKAPIIEPLLLEPSETVIKAERALKRKRINRELNNFYNSKSFEVNPIPVVDPSTILDEVLINTPHEPAFRATDNDGEKRESIDVNSYYSSQASWSGRSSEIDNDNNGNENTNVLGNDLVDKLNASQASADSGASDEEFEPEVTLDPADSFEPMVAEEQDRDSDIHEDYSPAPASSFTPEIDHSVDNVTQAWSHKGDSFAPDTDPFVDPIDRDKEENTRQLIMEMIRRSVNGQNGSMPQAISLNHIQSPAAPQPSHISPLASATLQDSFDQMNDLSSRSEQDQSNANKVIGKKRRKISGKSNNWSKKKRQRDSNSSEIRIKQEPTSPRLDQIPVHRRQGDERHTIEVPAGYKIVPIDDNNTIVARPPPTPAFPKVVFKDVLGKEFYAEPPASTSLYHHYPYQRRSPIPSHQPHHVVPQTRTYYSTREPMPPPPSSHRVPEKYYAEHRPVSTVYLESRAHSVHPHSQARSDAHLHSYSHPHPHPRPHRASGNNNISNDNHESRHLSHHFETRYVSERPEYGPVTYAYPATSVVPQQHYAPETYRSGSVIQTKPSRSASMFPAQYSIEGNGPSTPRY